MRVQNLNLIYVPHLLAQKAKKPSRYYYLYVCGKLTHMQVITNKDHNFTLGSLRLRRKAGKPHLRNEHSKKGKSTDEKTETSENDKSESDKSEAESCKGKTKMRDTNDNTTNDNTATNNTIMEKSKGDSTESEGKSEKSEFLYGFQDDANSYSRTDSEDSLCDN